jgi:hypothetical protein
MQMTNWQETTSVNWLSLLEGRCPMQQGAAQAEWNAIDRSELAKWYGCQFQPAGSGRNAELLWPSMAAPWSRTIVRSYNNRRN